MLANKMVVIKMRSFVRNGSCVAGPDKKTSDISINTFMKKLLDFRSSHLCNRLSGVLEIKKKTLKMVTTFEAIGRS